MVVKCAPGIDFDAVTRLGFSGEIEVTSYRGSVREACLWSAGLTESGVRRRASILDRGEQLTDTEPDDCPVGAPGRWIVDPDGAVVRAGLVRQFAARHRLWQLDPHIAYLSGDKVPSGVRGFEVLEQLPFDERRLRQALGALALRITGNSGPRRRCRSRRAAQTTDIAWQPLAHGGHHPDRLRCCGPAPCLCVPAVAVRQR